MNALAVNPTKQSLLARMEAVMLLYPSAAIYLALDYLALQPNRIDGSLAIIGWALSMDAGSSVTELGNSLNAPGNARGASHA